MHNSSLRRALTTVAVALGCALGGLTPAAQAAESARPDFQLPVPCGQQWKTFTHSGHSDPDNLDLLKLGGGSDGQPALASAAGRVTTATKAGAAGNYVVLDHGGGWSTRYLHLQDNSTAVRVGQLVAQGQQLGRVGNTGHSTGPHLHFEQRLNGDPVQVVFAGAPVPRVYTPGYHLVTSRNCGSAGATQFADVDGDGKEEIIAFQSNGDVVAYHNVNGYGGYEGGRFSVIGRGFTDPARTKFAEINGDRRAEIVVFQPGGAVVAYHNVNGFGGYEGARHSVIARGFGDPARTRFADIDGDGRDELVSLPDNGDVVAYHNINGYGGYEGARNSVIARGFRDTARTTFGEINGDAKNELISISPAGDVLAYHNINGFGGYEAARTSVIARGFTDPARTRFAEINGDGRDELVSLLPNGDVLAYHNVNGFGGYEGARHSVIARGFIKP
ncbi:peptidoglycan DD-metalloendopeptidase family protein [Crossiella sp. NPDC003009]